MGFVAGPVSITLGGSLLLAGARVTGTVNIPGATMGMHVAITPQTDLGTSAICGRLRQRSRNRGYLDYGHRFGDATEHCAQRNGMELRCRHPLLRGPQDDSQTLLSLAFARAGKFCLKGN